MADKQISQLIAAETVNDEDLLVLQQGQIAKKLTGKKLGDYLYAAAAEKIAEVNEAVAETQEAVDELEEQKNTIARTIADMAELGTDTTLTTPGMAADAKATGDKIGKVEVEALAGLNQKTVSNAAFASFNDGADNVPVKELIIDIKPVQSGSGTPSPTNVRPITGWTGANINVSGADTSNPTTYPISWETEAGTVYGGALDVSSGELSVKQVKVTLTGEEEFSIVAAGGTSQRFTLTIPTNTGYVDALVSHGTLSVSNTGVFGQFRVLQSGYFVVLDGNHHFADVTELKTWLAGQYSNGTPVEFVYGLTEETEYDLSEQEVSTLKGENNIWADTGNINSLIYYSMPIDDNHVDEKMRQLEEMISGVEPSGVASTNYASGVLIISEDVLVRLTANIVSGETISTGTGGNAIETTIEAELQAIKNSIPIVAGDISYDDTEIYPEYTVGSELKRLSIEIDSYLLDVVTSPNIFTGFTIDGGIDNTTGEDRDTASTLIRSDYIPIDNTKSKLYILRDNAPWAVRLFYYDSSKNFISPNDLVMNATTTGVKGSSDIPNNAAYVRTYRGKSTTAKLQFSYTEESEIYDPGTFVKLKPGIAVNSVTGKKIAFFGDSIIGNFNDSTGICAQIAKRTGATVLNCAFGGSRMAYRYGDNIQYTYWNALSGVGLAQAIATGTWTDQDTAVANMTGSLSYFSDRLAEIKAIDFDEVDYILWEYGANDFTTEVMLSDTSDATNLYAYDNAYRRAIETILTVYPNIQIVLVTPIWRFWQESGTYLYDSNNHPTVDYDGNTRFLPQFVTMVQKLAKEYQLPCIDDYWALGANKYTRSAFFDASDGTHPNANGRTRIAEHIATNLSAHTSCDIYEPTHYDHLPAITLAVDETYDLDRAIVTKPYSLYSSDTNVADLYVSLDDPQHDIIATGVGECVVTLTDSAGRSESWTVIVS